MRIICQCHKCNFTYSQPIDHYLHCPECGARSQIEIICLEPHGVAETSTPKGKESQCHLSGAPESKPRSWPCGVGEAATQQGPFPQGGNVQSGYTELVLNRIRHEGVRYPNGT